MLSHRERFLTALDLQEPDMVPITDLEIDPLIAAKTTGKQVYGFSSLTTAGLRGKKSVLEILRNDASVILEAHKKLDFDAIMVPDSLLWWNEDCQPKFVSINRFVDGWGMVNEIKEGTKTKPWQVDGLVKTQEDLEKYKPLDPYGPGAQELVEELISKASKEGLALVGFVHSGFSIAHRVRGGIDKFLIDMYKNPIFIKKLMDKIANVCLEITKILVDAGVDAILPVDDYAGSHGPFMPPKFFMEFELPYLKKTINVAKRKGIPVIKHTDGYAYPLMDCMLEAGINGLHSIEPGIMDLRDVKERYGNRLCLMGNVDCTYILPYGSEQDVRKDVRRCIDAAAEGGGFILSSSGTIHGNVKTENIYTMVDEARKYGKYPLRGDKDE